MSLKLVANLILLRNSQPITDFLQQDPNRAPNSPLNFFASIDDEPYVSAISQRSLSRAAIARINALKHSVTAELEPRWVCE